MKGEIWSVIILTPPRLSRNFISSMIDLQYGSWQSGFRQESQLSFSAFIEFWYWLACIAFWTLLIIIPLRSCSRGQFGFVLLVESTLLRLETLWELLSPWLFESANWLLGEIPMTSALAECKAKAPRLASARNFICKFFISV